MQASGFWTQASAGPGVGHFLPLFNKAARKQSATSSICSENLEHLPLGDRAVARETPPWGNHPSLITGGGQAGDTFFFLAMPWGQLLPSDLKKLREKEKRPSLTPPFRPHGRLLSDGFTFLLFFCISSSLQRGRLPFAGPAFHTPSFTWLQSETLCLPDPQAAGGGDGPPSK